MLTEAQADALRLVLRDMIVTADPPDELLVACFQLVELVTEKPTVAQLRETLETAEHAYLLASGWVRKSSMWARPSIFANQQTAAAVAIQRSSDRRPQPEASPTPSSHHAQRAVFGLGGVNDQDAIRIAIDRAHLDNRITPDRADTLIAELNGFGSIRWLELYPLNGPTWRAVFTRLPI